MTFNDDDTIVRLIRSSRMRRQGDTVIGIDYLALMKRPTEEYYSVSWCDFFEAVADEKRRAAISEIQRHANSKKSDYYLAVTLFELRSRAEGEGIDLDFTYEGNADKFRSHAGVWGLPSLGEEEDEQLRGLLDRLSLSLVCELISDNEVGDFRNIELPPPSNRGKNFLTQNKPTS